MPVTLDQTRRNIKRKQLINCDIIPPPRFVLSYSPTKCEVISHHITIICRFFVWNRLYIWIRHLCQIQKSQTHLYKKQNMNFNPKFLNIKETVFRIRVLLVLMSLVMFLGRSLVIYLHFLLSSCSFPPLPLASPGSWFSLKS